MQLEKDTEKKLTEALKKKGVWVEKYQNPFKGGYPDRLCIYRGGAFWVELKAKGKKLRPLQQVRKRELELQGCKVFVVDSDDKIKEVLDYVGQWQ